MTGRARYGRGHLSTKGYPRYHTGVYRGQYVHRVAYTKHLERQHKQGRSRQKAIPKDVDINHRNNNKLDFRIRNLQPLDHRQHGFVSARQSWYVRNIVEPRKKKEWDTYFGDNYEDVSFDVVQFE